LVPFPLFKNNIKRVFIEERTATEYWWTKDIERDPWLLRVKLAQNDNLVYGKFFKNKAGFISQNGSLFSPIIDVTDMILLLYIKKVL